MKKPRFLLPGTIRLDRASATPLSKQLAAQFRRAIRSGAFATGARLPSTRTLARQLAVSRNIVIEVFETLCIEGWLEARTGSGTRVKARAGTPDFLSESQYPARALPIVDPDGNPLYVRY